MIWRSSWPRRMGRIRWRLACRDVAQTNISRSHLTRAIAVLRHSSASHERPADAGTLLAVSNLWISGSPARTTKGDLSRKEEMLCRTTILNLKQRASQKNLVNMSAKDGNSAGL